jgi:hypothetical protein
MASLTNRLLIFLNPLHLDDATGHFGFNRQTLVGGNYELLDTDTLAPKPDFWTATLYTSLMGKRVVEMEMT